MRLRAAAPYAAVAALSLFLAGGVLQIWRLSPRVALDDRPDAIANLALIKTIHEQGWFLRNPRLGGPHGQELYDFPNAEGDLLHLLAIRGLTQFTADPAVVANIYYLASFPLVACVAFWALRRQGIGIGPAVVAATLFALLPYHFVRGINHLFLATYVAVPLGCHLALAVLRGLPFASEAPRRERLAALALPLIIGTSSFYYALFTVVLLVPATLLAALVKAPGRPLRRGAAATLLVLASVATLLTPSALYWLRHGRNPAVHSRAPLQSELFALKLTQLVLPREQHRIPALARLKQRYVATAPHRGEYPDVAALGAVGTVGLLWLSVVLLAAGGRGRRPLVAPPLARAAAVLAALAFAFGTLGGAGSLFAYLVTPPLRCVGRMSVFLGFLALAAVAERLDALRRGGAVRAPAAHLILAAVLVIGVLDQTTRADVPAYRALAEAHQSDSSFVAALERRLPAGALVLQLPPMPFPESPPRHRMADYSHLRPYLHSRTLRWTYGAMRERPGDWTAPLGDATPADVVLAARQRECAGIEIDRFGFADGGQVIEGELRRLLGVEPLASVDGRLSFFDLTAAPR